MDEVVAAGDADRGVAPAAEAREVGAAGVGEVEGPAVLTQEGGVGVLEADARDAAAGVPRLGGHLQLDAVDPVQPVGRKVGAAAEREEPRLVELERSGRLDTLVTQNVDGLHQKAGTDPARIVEIHGTGRDVVCLLCGDRQPAEPVHARVRAGEEDPACTVVGDDGQVCGGILKTATISFGQSLVPEDLLRAELAAESCDLLLTVGSTLGVFPAAGMVPIAVRHGAVVVIVNGGRTEMDELADVVVFGSISEVLPAMVEGLAPAG